MKKPRGTVAELPLFDPPPSGEGAPPPPPPVSRWGREEAEPFPEAELPLFRDEPGEELAAEGAGQADATPAPQPLPAPFLSRLLSGLADLAVHGAVVALLLFGLDLMAVRVSWAEAAAPLLLFLAAFSLLYTSVPLAFWGQTPGMAAAGLFARSPGDEPLSFAQTSLRWAAGVVTVLLAGLPALIALSGASLADRVSDSRVFLQPSPR